MTMLDVLLLIWFGCVVLWTAFMLVVTWHDHD